MHLRIDEILHILYLFTGMPFFFLNCHQVPGDLTIHCWSADLTILLLEFLCRQSNHLYIMTVLLFVFQPLELFTLFLFIILTLIFSFILLCNTSTTLNRNDSSGHTCFIHYFKEMLLTFYHLIQSFLWVSGLSD